MTMSVCCEAYVELSGAKQQPAQKQE
jgi:hypothetical protein